MVNLELVHANLNTVAHLLSGMTMKIAVAKTCGSKMKLIEIQKILDDAQRCAGILELCRDYVEERQQDESDN